MKNVKLFSYQVLIFLVISGCGISSKSDPSTGPEMIKASINYHDPEGQWTNFKGTLFFEDSLPPHREDRVYQVELDNSNSEMTYSIEGLKYQVIQDSVVNLEGEVEEERALRMRNYYTYLWGLPMKLNDPGTIIEEEVSDEILNGKTYHVIRIPYEKDIWYFYLEPETYRMAAYKFYQDEPNEKGEIIYLDGELEHNGMKIPQNRTWYRTEIPEFLATDKLVKIEGEN
ncbi:DUF6503 family protein [Algoriphagus sediminis]|uniref:DUF6503 family protein n=1 Tax=Algoriphagus sediminis TaxID=3057113 RepID=A0ABT7YAY3_9BACT|nr:DUF6503 family protein [Algoriphagus sediminis]MDN3203653.1 DUF6503 family protein [Algoriphagus sediminis]